MDYNRLENFKSKRANKGGNYNREVDSQGTFFNFLIDLGNNHRVEQSPIKGINFGRRMSIEDGHDNKLEEGYFGNGTPHLGSQVNEDNVKASQYDKFYQSYLTKHEVSTNLPSSNHLYKFKSNLPKNTPDAPIPNHLIRLPIENTQDIFVQGKNPDMFVSQKRNIQHTPLNSNLQKYIESFVYETPSTHSGGKLLKFTAPSTGAESITTATSMRKNPHRVTPNGYIQSPTESRNESFNVDFNTKLRYTPSSGKNDLLKQSLERIDRAVRRNGKQLNSYDEVPPLEFKHALSHAQLREYLDSEEGSTNSRVQVGLNPIPSWKKNNIRAFSENVTSSIAYESEVGDIENFTLGPEQFSKLQPFASQKAASSKRLIEEFQKEKDRQQRVSRRNLKRNEGKFASADRIKIKSK